MGNADSKEAAKQAHIEEDKWSLKEESEKLFKQLNNDVLTINAKEVRTIFSKAEKQGEEEFKSFL